MLRLTPRRFALAVALWMVAAATDAHPAPFSYVDVRVQADRIDLALVVHIFDAAHEVGVATPEQMLDAATLAAKAREFGALMTTRLQLLANGRPLPLGPWSAAEALPERQSIRLVARAPLPAPAGTVAVKAYLFPYDAAHQTFVNFWESDTVTAQAILDATRTNVDYYAGTTPGLWAMVRSLVPGGTLHVIEGADHLLMLLGLLLAGGSRRRVIGIATAFVVGQAITMVLASYNLLVPPMRLVDPALALSTVYVGADNLMVRGGRDVRVWMSLALGAIHGAGAAAGLRALNMPRWMHLAALASFSTGVEVGQLAVAAAIVAILVWLRARSAEAGRRVSVVGSVAIIGIGALMFVQRVFFPGGLV